MSNNDRSPLFVMVPGAWLGGWSWHPLAAELTRRGATAFPLTLPGLEYGSPSGRLRLADAVDHVVESVEAADLHDVTLVAHSWGGYPATGAAHRLADRLSSVVYYNAVVPQAGVAMVDENPEYGAIMRGIIEQSPDRTVTVPAEMLAPSLLAGEDPTVQQVVCSLTTPQPGNYMLDALDVGPVTEAGIPASYLWSSDIGLARPGVEFAARLGVPVREVPGSHMGMFTRPADLVDAFLEAAAAPADVVTRRALPS